MSTTQTKQLSSVPAVAAVGEGDKIPIVNASGQTVLVPLSGLLAAVKVGGRNLIKNSGVKKSNNSDMMATYYYGEDAPTAGEKLVVSVWAELGPEVSLLTFFNYYVEGGYSSFSIRPTDIKQDGRYVKQITSTKQSDRIVVFQGAGHQNNTTIERIKVERGNIPTDWTPAPEDWGGVKLSSSAICAFVVQLSTQKGGPLHEPNKAAYKRSAQRHHVGRDVAKRESCRCGHGNYFGNLHNKYRQRLDKRSNNPNVCRDGGVRRLKQRCTSAVLLDDKSIKVVLPTKMEQLAPMEPRRRDSNHIVRKEVAA